MKKRLRYFIYFIGSFTVAFFLFSLYFLPFISKEDIEADFKELQEETKDVVTITDEVLNTPYDYIAPTDVGMFGRYVVNKTYAKKYLKDHFYWSLKASPNNETWYDASEGFSVNLTWNDTDCFYKVDLILNTSSAPTDLYYRFVLATNLTLKDIDIDNKNTSLVVRMPTAERDYNIFFNWSDIKSLISSGKVWIDKGVKNDYLYFMIQTVNKIAPDKLFIIDPAYGTIANSVVDSWEYDGQEGRQNGYESFLKLGDSEYYVSTARGDSGSDNDGFLRVFHIFDSNGTITESLVDSWEFDTDSGYCTVIYHLADEYYLVAYADQGSTTNKLFTTRIFSSNGTLGKVMIDTLDLQNSTYYYEPIVVTHVTGDIYAVSYKSYTDWKHHMKTVKVYSNNGTIRDSVIDYQLIHSLYADNEIGTSDCVMVDDDTIAIAYIESIGYDYFLKTFNISSTGEITDTAADTWEFDDNATSASYTKHTNIRHIDGNVFAISYSDVDLDGVTKTLTIGNDGVITKSWIDTLEFVDNAYLQEIYMFTVADASDYSPGVYGITYVDIGGTVLTFNISSDGTIGNSVIDTLKFTNSDQYHNPVQHMADDYYAIAYTGSGYDGYICTINISTPEPVAGVSWQLQNTTQGVYVNTTSWQQQNFTQGVYTNTTRWQLQNTTQGVYVNTTSWQQVNFSQGVYVNTTNFHTHNLTQGIYVNTTRWQLQNTSQGVYTNNSVIHLVNYSQGVYTNTTQWQQQNFTQGIYINTTQFHTHNITFGVYVNTTTHHQVNFSQGVYINSTSIHQVNFSQGVYVNTSAPWNNVNTTQGVYINTTAQHLVNFTQGVYINTTSIHLVNYSQGVYINNTRWQQVNFSQGVYTNTTSAVFQQVNYSQGVYVNTTRWQQQNFSQGVYINTSSIHQVNYSQGVYINTTSIHEVNFSQGVYTNTTAITWQLQNLSIGVYINTTTQHLINFSQGVYTNNSVINLVNFSQGVYTNSTPWNTANILQGVYVNTSISTGIYIHSPYPSNNSNIYDIQPELVITVAHNTSGRVMNLTWYYGNSSENTTNLYTIETNITNGTYNQDHFTATEYYQDYYWRVEVNDGTNTVNRTYIYESIMTAGGVRSNAAALAIGAGGFMLATFAFLFLFRRRRK